MAAIVIHAGLPKTGTTYLQQRFVANRSWLADRGVHYPTMGQEIGPGHHNLAQVLADKPVEEPWAQQPPGDCVKAAIVTDCPRVLLSSETFSSLHPAPIKQLKAALHGHDVTYVLHLRRRSALAFSRWQEEVKHGSARSFAEFLADQLVGVGNALRIENPVIIALQTFGVAALRLIVFEELIARQADLFDHFVEHILELDPSDAVPAAATSANAALPAPTIEALRAINAANAAATAWANGGVHFATAALHWLKHDPAGQQLLRNVTSVFEQHAESKDLAKLDHEWQQRDQEILGACRDQTLNATGEWQLFPNTPHKPVRTLRPSVLYEHIPVAQFTVAAKLITKQRNQ